MCGDEQIQDCSITMCKVCCTNMDKLRELLRKWFNDNQVSEIKFKQWSVGAVKCSLDTILEDDVEKFIRKFISNLEKLIPHHFISKEQSKFLKEKKESLEDDELLIQCDFAENYSFIVQNSVQGYHWNNAQATIHPFVIYYKDAHSTSVKHATFIIISNCMAHDSIAVHLFKTKMIQFIKKEISSSIKKIFYMSDGAVTQYKNLNNLINLSHHEDDFNIKAEWHFHATSHGKGACDGVGGTFKRGAYRYSLTKGSIQTPQQLYEWAKSWESTMHFEYATKQEYNVLKKRLESKRYNSAKTIKGTQGYHCFIPKSKKEIVTKSFSNSKKEIEHLISY